MTDILSEAVVYDIESFPNAFTLTAESLHGDSVATWEISDFRNDIYGLVEWFDYLARTGTPMIGFNSIGYDYPVLHHIRVNPHCTVADIYAKSMSIINSNDRFGQTIWPRDRMVPQIDLFKVHHFDNEAKRTSLKALQINMRAHTVMESRIPFGTVMTQEQIINDIIPYNVHDVKETKRFAHYSLKALEFRASLIDQFGIDVLNWNDTKIGEEMLIRRLGEDICYDRVEGRRVKRQTIRYTIPVRDMIFPYIGFETPELQRVLSFMQSVTLQPEDMKKETARDHESPLSIKAQIGGLTFAFGSGGVHASVENKRFYSDDQWIIRDIDVAGMYPAISIVNRLAPEHLGAPFVEVYASLPKERAQHKKGTPENARLKLAGNAAWGKSKSPYSPFYDPKYALTVPITGQLMICMLVEQLLKVPTLQLIQANTDGVTYYVQRSMLDQCKAIEDWWQKYTLLKLEDVEYKVMFVRDVNNYVAEDVKGKRKLKGAYWYPDPLEYAEAINNSSPPAWHKNFNPVIVQRAAVAAMLDGIDPGTFLRSHTDPFDFMCSIKTQRGSQLMLGDDKTQNNFRYYVSTNGKQLTKIMPPPKGFEVGMWKKAPKVSAADYHNVMKETGGAWDGRVCTKSQSKYDNSATNIQAGWLVSDCCDMTNFRFDNLNYDWYIAETMKLVI